MANIVRYHPFDEAFEDLFRGFLLGPVAFDGVPAADKIKMDVTENEKEYVVKAEIPGVKKEDISVSINGNQVSIGAEVKNEKVEKEGGKVLRAERSYGRVSRSFQLAQEVDEASSSAKYENGVLELALPKKALARAKTLAIH